MLSRSNSLNADPLWEESIRVVHSHKRPAMRVPERKDDYLNSYSQDLSSQAFWPKQFGTSSIRDLFEILLNSFYKITGTFGSCQTEECNRELV